MKKAWVDVDSKARERHNAYGVLENDHRNGEETEEAPSPVGLEKHVASEEASDQHSQARTYTTAFLGNLNLYAGQ
jgi:hypothetical protein